MARARFTRHLALKELAQNVDISWRHAVSGMASLWSEEFLQTLQADRTSRELIPASRRFVSSPSSVSADLQMFLNRPFALDGSRMFRENPGETEAKRSPFPKEPATGVIKQRQRGRKCNIGTEELETSHKHLRIVLKSGASLNIHFLGAFSADGGVIYYWRGKTVPAFNIQFAVINSGI